jgi:hypothetical protein
MLRQGTLNSVLMDFAPPSLRSGLSCGLDSRFEIHDDNQVELKLDYAIDEARKWTRYQTEAFIFVPKSLGISKQSYDRKQFFSDTQAYIRFKTPSMTFAAMVDPANTNSPLMRIRQLMMKGELHSLSNDEGTLSQELRMFGCLVRANLRETMTAACERLGKLETKTGRGRVADDLAESIKRVTGELTAVCDEFRNLRPMFVGLQCPDWLRERFEYTDEFLSITVESYLTELLVAIEQRRDKRKLRELTEDAWQRIAKTIAHEQLHRKELGYTTHLDDVEGRNLYVKRASALKKFITSVLFLNIEPKKEDVSFVQVTAGFAAALAMAFSMGAAFLSERIWGLNSLPFVLAVVVGYVFKDRIKDWVKLYFSTRIAQWMPDRSLRIVDPSNGTSVGKCRETFSYLRDSRIPKSVRRWRHGNGQALELEYNPEVCLHYIKDVGILGKQISTTHDRRKGINDIIRWNVSSFLSRMDDPERHVDFLDGESLELRTAVCPKRYELNVVLVLKESDRLVSVQRYRVELDRTGIHSLESMPLAGVDGPLSDDSGVS